jgi:hypothetical protein
MATNADTKISLLTSLITAQGTFAGTERIPLSAFVNGTWTSFYATAQQVQQALGISALNPVFTGTATIPNATGTGTWVNSGVTILSGTATDTFSSPLLISGTATDTWSAPLSVTGPFVVPNGQTGRTTAPPAGTIGEEIIVSFTSVSLVSNTSTNVGTLPLTAGVWDVSGAAVFSESSGGAWPMSLGINTVSATLPALGFYAQGVQAAAGGGYALVSPIKRVTLSASTSIFLVASSTFTAGTMMLSGFVRAVRVA